MISLALTSEDEDLRSLVPDNLNDQIPMLLNNQAFGALVRRWDTEHHVGRNRRCYSHREMRQVIEFALFPVSRGSAPKTSTEQRESQELRGLVQASQLKTEALAQELAQVKAERDALKVQLDKLQSELSTYNKNPPSEGGRFTLLEPE